jgi:hypothetical protein
VGDGGLAAGEIVDVVSDVAGLVGLVDDIVAEVVTLPTFFATRLPKAS